MKKTTYFLAKMDCPSEEHLVRVALTGNPAIKDLTFDLSRQRVMVTHSTDQASISRLLAPLNLGERFDSEDETNIDSSTTSKTETGALRLALTINFAIFVLELGYGIASSSMGLIGDSLDMLADAAVYLMSLMVVGAAASRKVTVARTSGVFQFVLAFVGMLEIARRVFVDSETPEYVTMIVLSAVALVGNVATLFVLKSKRDSGAHMKASWIFTSNDIKANIGVILAAIVVKATGSKLPDLVIGAIVFTMVAKGARDIFRISAEDDGSH